MATSPDMVYKHNSSMVEHQFDKLNVTGSNPVHATNKTLSTYVAKLLNTTMGKLYKRKGYIAETHSLGYRENILHMYRV